ncbi:hypothetical protein [Rhizobium ruizarguesonis]|uniref:hypothetical protein n=1 Tax=Rhizobium ruizarguesonis TaxID=2081791 RepID=UPI0013C25BD0|nr:hypothetical protein [Rhizobium ruizarguesonis]NEJ03218.1 hypothetical protein [Rhizobium ruizarguesonis]NEJ40385.1 hypothetical protein [Rhizobium ruizarguesonis]
MDANLEKLPDEEQLLDLYKHQYEMFDKSLATERDIVVKNFAAFGAVLLAQNGFLLSSLKPHLVLAVCGIVLFAISIAARAMAIIYSKYSDRLYMLADITLAVYLRGLNGLNIRKRRLEARNGVNEEGMPVAKKLPNADDLSWSELLWYRGALSIINLIPALVGVLMVIAALIIWCCDADPWWQLTNPSQVKAEKSAP